jgi:hypothetical protein
MIGMAMHVNTGIAFPGQTGNQRKFKTYPILCLDLLHIPPPGVLLNLIPVFTPVVLTLPNIHGRQNAYRQESWRINAKYLINLSPNERLPGIFFPAL